MKHLVESSVNYLASGLEFLTAIVIAHAAALAIYRYFADAFSNRTGLKPKLEIRLALGRALTVALEVLLAADILKTALAPTWTDIGQLAAIATIRTLLNYFLERELDRTNVEH